MMAELLACPFCGGEAECLDMNDLPEDDPNVGGSCISCKRCGASSPLHFDRKENLYSSWNTRCVPEAEVQRAEYVPAAALAERDATIAALRAEVERLTGGIAEMVERMHHVKAEQAEWLAKCLSAVKFHEAEIARLHAGIKALAAELEQEHLLRIDAEGSLWRIMPNCHTVGEPADPFEGPGETYRAAYERVEGYVRSLQESLAEERLEVARLVLERDELTNQLDSARHFGERLNELNGKLAVERNVAREALRDFREYVLKEQPAGDVIWRGGAHHNPIWSRIAAEIAKLEPWKTHDLYQTGDPEAPEQIKDSNGEVVLGCCRRCGRAEIDLSELCPEWVKANEPETPSDGAISSAADSDDIGTPFAVKDRTFDITGMLETMTRYEARAWIESLGGRVTGKVVSRLAVDYVVAGPGGWPEVKAAQDRGIPVLSESEWLEAMCLIARKEQQ